MSQRIRRRAARIDLVTVAGLAAALPVIVSTVRAVRAGWLPVGDDAMIVVRSLDVLSTRPPLLGSYSASGSVVGEAVSSPGPMLFWLLALPARAGHAAPAIAMGVVNTAAVMGVVALARRRGGIVLMVVVAGAMALMCRSLQAQIYHDVWNPSAAVLPFALLLFLAWSVAAGEHALLPLMAVVGSFAAQAQLTYALPVVAVVAVSLAFLLASDAIVPRRTVVIAVLALLVCWSLPLAEQAIHRPGNLVLIARVAASDADRFGWEAGWHSVEHAVGVPPWWLRTERDELGRLADVGFAPGALMTASALALLAALVAALAVALRRRQRELAAGLALALALCVTLAAVTARSPTEHNLFATIGYTLWWASVAGAFVWVVLAWAAVNLVRPLPRAQTAGRATVLGGIAAVAAIGVLVSTGERRDPRQSGYRPVGRLLERVREAVRPGPTVRLEGPSPASGLSAGPGPDVVAAVAYELRRDGVRFVTDDVIGVGHRYDPEPHPYPYRRRLDVTIAGGRLPADRRVIARAVVLRASGPNPTAYPVVLTLSP